jgi:hypothetical protein
LVRLHERFGLTEVEPAPVVATADREKELTAAL